MGQIQEEIYDLEPEMTKDELWEIEQSHRSNKEKVLDFIIPVMPYVGFVIALSEYLLIPDKYQNPNPERYIIALAIPLAFFTAGLFRAIFASIRGNKQFLAKVRHTAPFMAGIYVLLSLLDWATLKTGLLLYPFIPWVNDIINIAITDHKQLIVCTLYSVRLLLLGYFAGCLLGLITGVACGYNKMVNYWITPIVKILGPIPTATWIPLLMLIAKSLMGGAIFIVGLGAWFAVTVATTTGIQNVDKAYFNAARTMGATSRQLIFKIAIPSAMPNILQGMTQAMSSACVSLIIAEMMGVKSGLGWYITWSKSWAAYNKMFAAIIIICVVFNLVTRLVEAVKKRMLRWQIGVTK